MFKIHALLLGFATCSLFQLGCAAFSKSTDTPAAKVSFEELNIPDHPPGERYYLLVFGSQTIPKLPRYTHTWVTLVRTSPSITPGSLPTIESHTISWMPASLDIHPWRFRVEQGVNLDLDRSLQNAVDTNQSISMWGPYEVPVGLYRKGIMQKSFIESGAIGYQCIDTIGEAAVHGNGSNCVHAITDADSRYDRQAYPLAYYGKSASEHLLDQVVSVGGIADTAITHDWLLPGLKLDQYPINRRSYRPSHWTWFNHIGAK